MARRHRTISGFHRLSRNQDGRDRAGARICSGDSIPEAPVWTTGAVIMRFHADLHIHSKYSRATSRDLDLEHLAYWAALKGIGVVATGDFTHPAWAAELKSKLVPAEPGLFRLAPEIEKAVAEKLPPACRAPVRFLLEVERRSPRSTRRATRRGRSIT
jgi:hypothetical protein